MDPQDDVTRLLKAWSAGDPKALDELLPLVYEDLRRMAGYFFKRERRDHTLQPTALISEVYFRLKGQQQTKWESRADFFSFAADVMRHFLVDHARRHRAEKRGGSADRVPLDTLLEIFGEIDLDLVDLHQALEQLAALDSRQAEVVKLRFFVGLKVEEIADLLEISTSTVKREWRTARFWLRRRLTETAKEDRDSDAER